MEKTKTQPRNLEILAWGLYKATVIYRLKKMIHP